MDHLTPLPPALEAAVARTNASGQGTMTGEQVVDFFRAMRVELPENMRQMAHFNMLDSDA